MIAYINHERQEVIIMENEVMNVDQAAEFLQLDSRNVIYRLIKLKGLPARRAGKRYILSRRSLLEWLEEKPKVKDRLHV